MGLHAAWQWLYGPFAWLFDPVTHYVSRGHWQAWGRASLAYLPHLRVLELAHGPGHLLIALKQAGYRPVGIDRSPPMSRRASRRLRRAGLAVPLVRARAQALPFRAGRFDAVVATFPTDYIFDPDTLREVARVTSEEGHLVIVAGAQSCGTQPDRHFLDWLARQIGESGTGRNGAASVFTEVGLRARIECRNVDGTTVILILAEKARADVVSVTDADIEELTRLESALTLGGR